MWGLLSLWLLNTGRFRLWMIWPSALGVCFFVLLSAWLSVLNTGVSGFYLSIMPTLWLTPIVLACGALRFRPVLQIVMAAEQIAGFGSVSALAHLGGAAVGVFCWWVWRDVEPASS